MRKTILNAPVDLFSRTDTLSLLSDWIEADTSMKLVVTAYSEFFVRAFSDPEFSKVMNSADLVTPDGVSVLAAVSFLERSRGRSVFGRLYEGVRVGVEILSGKMDETITGVWLFDELTKMAVKKKWKLFLLGGWNNVSGRATVMLQKRFPGIKVAYDEGEERVGSDEKKNKQVIAKINEFEPDILFVSYNPIKQEKWMYKHRSQLKAKIGIGVGGTFNEYLGEFKKAPTLMERMGLKWLWRLMVEPRRFGRIMRAVIVFPWLVFKKGEMC